MIWEIFGARFLALPAPNRTDCALTFALAAKYLSPLFFAARRKRYAACDDFCVRLIAERARAVKNHQQPHGVLAQIKNHLVSAAALAAQQFPL